MAVKRNTLQGDAKHAKQLRAIGRSLTDMKLSLFIACRYDFRRPIRIYGNATQSLTVSGLDKIREEFLCLDRQLACVCGLQALRGLVEVCSLLFSFAASKAEGGVRCSMRTIFDFACCMGQRSSLFKIYLTTTHRLLEVLFAKTFLGVPHQVCGTEGH